LSDTVQLLQSQSYLSRILSSARGAIWRARGRSIGWPLVPPTVTCRCRWGTVTLGHQVELGRGVILEAVSDTPSKTVSLEIGDRTKIGVKSRVMAHDHISIGVDCVICWDCTILDCDLHSLSYDGDSFEVNSGPIVIENHVWVGYSVTVLKGVRIGEGAVIAPNSVVTKDIPPRTLASGIPAVPVGTVQRWK
jgi:acetyltransferase-like isoleucine patch superfamily enzyme